ncbi:hypothetical protein EVAR_68187_1 [Eumeta japonica]|uniref:Uncharacterized protein n=1 Tax=Eumeta variegata TaxID=151549 RepID=A0A4C1SXE2_EUMVA|nr:hypothetical protein EVAR_68187_1 [Eumeta japonica]
MQLIQTKKCASISQNPKLQIVLTEDDAQVFSSLHSSSANSSSTTGNSKLMCSGLWRWKPPQIPWRFNTNGIMTTNMHVGGIEKIYFAQVFMH